MPPLPRRTNLALGGLLVAAGVSGTVAYGVGVDLPLDVTSIHGAIGLGVLLLAPWKQAIVRRGLARRRPSRWWSLALLGCVVTALATGVLHATGVVSRLGPLTLMQVHVGTAIAALVLVVVHWTLHPVTPHRTDLDRRALLRAGWFAAAAATTLLATEAVMAATRLPGARRRFTGSHERGSGRPAAMPVTQWFTDTVPRVDASAWRLRVGDRELDLDDLARLGTDEVTAVLDCTGGWFAEQTWTGVRLDRLLGDEGGMRSVLVRSVTGYSRRLPAGDLERLWLATAVAGAPLSAGHGFPARLVAPGRRGFWWVKWVVALEPSPLPWWWQPPFPLR